MTPRKYDMSRRGASAAQTRQRIIEATFDVHAEQGISGARLEDIAQRAGVAVGTVYRHFPRYEDLVAACGRLTWEISPPPSPEDAAAAFAGLRGARARMARLVDELFGFYEATGAMVERLRADREALAPVDTALAEVERGIAAWIDEALRPLRAPDRAVVAALVDHRTWSALVAHGVEDPRAAVVALLA